MPGPLEFVLNGRSVRVEDCSPNTPLLDYLRATGLTGSKEGCAEGDCGACSVVIVDRDAEGKPAYRAINSCLTPVCLMAGRELITVEGVACNGKPHPVQEKMTCGHGSQCGYCTPGFIAALFEGYYRADIRTEDQLDDQLSGNLCRCTGYRPIREAALAAFPERNRRNGNDPFALQLQKHGGTLGAAEYEAEGEKFFRPSSLRELLELRQQHPEARLIAGATELGLDISKRFKTFSKLISVEAVPELLELEVSDGEWRIGGAATLTRIEERVATEYPALRDMLRVFGSRQIRNRATMGGNIVTASPIGDSAPVLLALDAQVALASLGGGHNGDTQITERTLPISEFFLAYRKTALRPDEILKTILLPRTKPDRGTKRVCAWYKVSKRREMDISTVAACLRLDLDAVGKISVARLAYGGVAATPSRAQKTEAALLGKIWNAETVRDVAETLGAEFTPISDVRGDAAYRRGLIVSLLEKFQYDTAHGSRNGTDELQRPLKFPSRASANEPRPLPHESGHKHVNGEAIYTDDQAVTRHMLEVWPVCAPHAHARILRRDASVARKMPGIAAVLLAEDVPGENNVGSVKKDEILLADKEISFHGQIVALVVGESPAACRAAAAKVEIEYEPLPAILTLEQAVAQDSYHNEPNFIRRGEIEPALEKSPVRLTGTFELQGQEHFYLEMNAAWAERGEDGSVHVVSSTQHPSEVQMVVGHVLHLPSNRVVVQVPRMGGGFGGKETQAATPAALAALATYHTGKPVRVRWNRDQDMILTGHRHPFLAKFEVGFDRKGKLLAVKVHLVSNGGWSQDLSQAVTDRALFHLDNAYYIPAAEFRGRVAKTHLSSNTAFRGFGGPQGMVVIEEIMDRVARKLGLPPEEVRERNLYRGTGDTNTTHYGQPVGDNRIQKIWRELKRSSAFTKRRTEVAAWNRKHPHHKRGLAITPVKFGISFTVTHLNQAGALVVAYQDGTIQINHAGTEMGQGLNTNVAAVAGRQFGVPPAHIRVMTTSTDKVPNTSATAASCGTDLNGAAVKNACDNLRARLAPIAADLLAEKLGRRPEPETLVWAEEKVFSPRQAKVSVSFAQVVRRAYFERVSLSATGFYATPGIHWDRVAGRGRPFFYFACGAAVTEVEVDGFTGMTRVRRVDILHDAGESINAGINRGQIEGGFIQGMGWMTSEELKWDDKGRLLSHSPDTYKIPSVGDTPRIFNVAMLKRAAQDGVVFGSKAVGEPPFMLAISVREAIRDAVASFGEPGGEVQLALPATCEAIYSAIRKRAPRAEPKVSPRSRTPEAVAK